MNILINGVGGVTPRSIARSIKKCSIYDDARLFGTDVNLLSYGLYEEELYEQTYVIPPAGNEEYWNSLTNIIEKHGINMALIQPEQEILEWARHKKEGGLWPCQALLPDYNVVKVLVNKGVMTRILKNSGLVPNSYLIDVASLNIDSLERILSYPFWIRSTTGSCGIGALKIENRKTLLSWININSGIQEFIGSAYLPGRNLTCKLLYHNGELLRSACGERVNYIMSKVAPSGITGNTSFGRLLNEPALVEVATKAMDAIFEAVGAPKHGFYSADLKEDEFGRPFITEINVRMVAFNYSFAIAGSNFAEDIIRLLSNDPTYDRSYKMFEFEPDTIFLRDVDSEPILMKETDLKNAYEYSKENFPVPSAPGW